jgi:general secretion pathway protein J
VRTSGSRGFTLMEIALAVSIVAVMGTLTWGSLSQSFDAYETVKDIDQRYHNVRVAMNRMSREIAMAFLTQPGRDFGKEQMWKTAFVGKSGSDFAELQFTSFAHEVLREDAKESDQCEIGYTVERDEEDREKRNLGQYRHHTVARSSRDGGLADRQKAVLTELASRTQMFNPGCVSPTNAGKAVLEAYAAKLGLSLDFQQPSAPSMPSP